jgi:hypothetical protein
MMSQNSKPLITIVGALSKQGRSGAHTLLQSGRYRVRAVTRRVDAPAAGDIRLEKYLLLGGRFERNGLG